MSLDSIVSVTITTGTSAVSQAGFGVPLIAGYHNEYADIVRTYDAADGLSALTSDGFASTDPIYLAASALLSQNPKVSQFKVGKLSTSTTQTIDLVPIAINAYTYTITIGGEEFSYLSDSSATVAEITAGLTTAVNGGTVAVTATDGTTKVTLTADAANTFYVIKDYDKANLRVTDVSTAQAQMSTDLDAIVVEDDDWYCLLIASQRESDIAAAAAWTETKKKIFLCNSADYGIISSSTTDVASDLETAAYARTAIMYHANLGEHAGAAWAGQCLPLDPGSETWAYKTLASISADTLTATQRGFVEAKNANHYTTVAGNNITRYGLTSAGEYIDVTRFVDWVQARIQEEVFGLLINNIKVPYTDKGVAMVKGKILGVLRAGVAVGGLAEDPAPAVFAPLVADVSSLDKANRLLPDVTFTATLAGAVHTLQISGTLSV